MTGRGLVGTLGAFALVALAALPSCSSSPEDFPDPDVAGNDANPDGVPYPTNALGSEGRSGTHAGDRIPNLTFQGYPESDRAGGLKTISLADYFDPEQKRHKLLHLQVAATWCGICSAESDATVIVKEPLGQRGAVFLQVVASGNTNAKGPSLEEVESWMGRHGSNYSVAIDVRYRRVADLGVNTVPWNILIDTRTMEIIHTSGGAPRDLGIYVKEGLKWVAENPPSY